VSPYLLRQFCQARTMPLVIHFLMWGMIVLIWCLIWALYEMHRDSDEPPRSQKE